MKAVQQVILGHGGASWLLDLVVSAKDATPLSASGDVPRGRYMSRIGQTRRQRSSNFDAACGPMMRLDQYRGP
jgi:hypothetical protein